jgi:hypothetical protein
MRRILNLTIIAFIFASFLTVAAEYGAHKAAAAEGIDTLSEMVSGPVTP